MFSLYHKNSLFTNLLPAIYIISEIMLAHTSTMHIFSEVDFTLPQTKKSKGLNPMIKGGSFKRPCLIKPLKLIKINVK